MNYLAIQEPAEEENRYQRAKFAPPTMIHHHQSISLFGQPLFTWIDLTTPMREPLPIPAAACFSYILDGQGHRLSKRDNILAQPGQVILSLCGMTFGRMLVEQEAGKVSAIIIHFHPDQLKRIYQDEKPPFWRDIQSPVNEYVTQMAASQLIQLYIESIRQFFEYQAAITEDILILKLKEIILLLIQTEESPQISKMIRSLFSERTFSFKELVDAHICQPVTIENLAQLTNCSLSTFKREFKRIYGTSPGAYMLEKRTEKVAQLLQLSEDSISTIGYDCGFNSPAHLTRVFKAKYGITPSQYRLNLVEK